MNARIIELLQQPSLMQANDLQLLEKQIAHTPYVQNVRALYLYGIHLYNPARYKEVLTTTAAYTTDKKILYQFINKKNITESSVEPELKAEESTSVVNNDNKIDKSIEAIKTSPFSSLKAKEATSPISEKEAEVESGLSLESIDENLSENKVESSESEIQKEEDVMNVEEGSKDEVITDETPISEKETEVESGLSLESIDDNLTENKVESSESEIQKEEDVMNVEEGSKDEVITDETPISEKEAEVESDLSLESIDENLSENKAESSESEIQKEEDVVNVEEGSKDEVITDETSFSEKAEELNTDVSFEGIDDFLPQVKFEVPKNHHKFLNPPKFEVKEHKPVQIEEKPTGIVFDEEKPNNSEIEEQPVLEHQSLDFGPFSHEEEPIVKEEVSVPVEKVEEVSPRDSVESKTESSWKPMTLDANQPDALIGKTAIAPAPVISKAEVKTEVLKEETVELPKQEIKLEEVKQPQLSVESEAKEEQKDENTLEQTEEEKRPILNVSFFGDSLAFVREEEKSVVKAEENIIEEPKSVEEIVPVLEAQSGVKTSKSNVGQFINTWQSWLKIDRSAEIEKDKEVKKQKAIDEFIENQPKITQLKDEASFVIKEKKEDISHLMTETLANLYLEQKLYSKAIKAFETLITKHPDKAEYFAQKIEEVKEQRKA
ncbi:hypothetical protein [Soonwooa sp.]|uniref:tetratricopeptide repeat protein n=1 Tax=Soonwooa sp. TaxID=1938592 RepID=UPI002628C8F1|nr:hypothetical protein [Soonwooa sp.]